MGSGVNPQFPQRALALVLVGSFFSWPIEKDIFVEISLAELRGQEKSSAESGCVRTNFIEMEHDPRVIVHVIWVNNGKGLHGPLLRNGFDLNARKDV